MSMEYPLQVQLTANRSARMDSQPRLRRYGSGLEARFKTNIYNLATFSQFFHAPEKCKHDAGRHLRMLQSGRRRDFSRRPPTPPYVRLRIRRFCLTFELKYSLVKTDETEFREVFRGNSSVHMACKRAC